MESIICKKREFWIDLIKVISTFLIVMQHTIAQSWMNMPLTEIRWMMINFLFMLSRTAVPIFVICSGIGMLQKERCISEVWKKNILSLVKVYTSWMFIYGSINALCMYIEGGYSIRPILNATLKSIIFGEYHTWFVMMLIGLYMVTPLVYVMIQKYNNMVYFLLLAFTFTYVLPIFNNIEVLERLIDNLNNLHVNLVMGYLFYFVVGHFIVQLEIKENNIKWIILGTLVTFIATYLISIYMSRLQEHPVQTIYGEFSISGAVMTIGMVILFRYYGTRLENRMTNDSIKKSTAEIAQYGIAVYLMHPQLLRFMPDNQGMKAILWAIFIWGGLLFITSIIDRIPVLNKVLIRH